MADRPSISEILAAARANRRIDTATSEAAAPQEEVANSAVASEPVAGKQVEAQGYVAVAGGSAGAGHQPPSAQRMLNAVREPSGMSSAADRPVSIAALLRVVKGDASGSAAQAQGRNDVPPSVAEMLQQIRQPGSKPTAPESLAEPKPAAAPKQPASKGRPNLSAMLAAARKEGGASVNSPSAETAVVKPTAASPRPRSTADILAAARGAGAAAAPPTSAPAPEAKARPAARPAASRSAAAPIPARVPGKSVREMVAALRAEEDSRRKQRLSAVTQPPASGLKRLLQKWFGAA